MKSIWVNNYVQLVKDGRRSLNKNDTVPQVPEKHLQEVKEAIENESN